VYSGSNKRAVLNVYLGCASRISRTCRQVGQNLLIPVLEALSNCACSFVPADSATIGLTDKILARISTRETVSKVRKGAPLTFAGVLIETDPKYIYDRFATDIPCIKPSDEPEPSHH
jgi:hypothetical protein